MKASRSSIRLSAWTILLVLGACGDGATKSAPVATWHYDEVWRVGGEAEGPHSFDANFGLDLLPNGNLIHFDYALENFHVLNTDGTPAGSFGRKGSGPNELLEANGFVVDRDGVIIVNDRGNSRFTRFSSNGEPLGSVAIPLRFTRGLRWVAKVMMDGRLLERDGVPTDQGTFRDETRLWKSDLSSSEALVVDRCTVSGSPAATQIQIPIRNPAGGALTRVPLPFSGPWSATAIDPAGYVWGQPADGSSQVIRFPLRGCEGRDTVTLSPTTSLIPVSVMDSALGMLSRAAASMQGTLDLEVPPPAHFPSFFTLHVDDRSRLWVQRFGDAGQQVMEVFDSTGHPVAVLDSFPLGTRTPIVFKADRVYGFVTDADGVKYLVALRLNMGQ